MFEIGIMSVVLTGIQIVTSASVADSDLLADSVRVTFTNISLDQWHKGSRSSIFKSSLANLTTRYCDANSNKCWRSSTTSSVTFQATNVKFMENYPVNDANNDLEILLYIELPNSSPTTISGNTLLVIVTNGKSQLSSDVGPAIASVVSGTSLSSDAKRPDTRLNKTMIPFSFLLLLIVALTAWLLHRSNKKKKAREQREQHKLYKNQKNITQTEGFFAEKAMCESSSFQQNSSEIPLTQFRHVGGGESRCHMPYFDSTKAQFDVSEKKRHKRQRRPRKQLNKATPTDDSDEVSDEKILESDSELKRRPKKKGRRRRGTHRSAKGDDPDSMVDNGDKVAQEKESIEQCGQEDNKDSSENKGYQRDSENGMSGRSKTSDADSAVDLNSSVPSSAQQNRPRNLPPIAQAVQSKNC